MASIQCPIKVIKMPAMLQKGPEGFVGFLLECLPKGTVYCPDTLARWIFIEAAAVA
jgi:hypothetical protein